MCIRDRMNAVVHPLWVSIGALLVAWLIAYLAFMVARLSLIPI